MILIGIDRHWALIRGVLQKLLGKHISWYNSEDVALIFQIWLVAIQSMSFVFTVKST